MLASPGFKHIAAALDPDLIDELQARIQHWVDTLDLGETTAVFSTQADAQTRDQYFLDSARGIAAFLEADSVDDNGQLIRPRDQSINKIGHAMHDLDPVFARLGRHPVLVETLKQIANEPWALMQSMVIMKPPGIGGEVRWHQDGTFLIDRDESVIGIWIALEDADPDNACLQFKVDGHRDPLKEIYEVDHATGHNAIRPLADLAWPDEDGSETVFAPCKAGDALVFGGRIPHASTQNQSGRSRRAMTLHFRRASSPWSPTNWLQRHGLPDFLV